MHPCKWQLAFHRVAEGKPQAVSRPKDVWLTRYGHSINRIRRKPNRNQIKTISALLIPYRFAYIYATQKIRRLL